MFSGTEKFKFLEPSDSLIYFIENQMEKLVIPCTSVSGSPEDSHVTLYGMNRLNDPGCDHKPYMIPPGFSNCIPSSSNVVSQAQPLTFESYDPSTGVLLSAGANYSSRYVCVGGKDKQVKSGIFEPLNPSELLNC